jgi:hypothetical protein
VTVPAGVNWTQVVDAVAQFDASAITLSSLTQTDNKIQLIGHATNNDAVVRFQQSLLDSRAFQDVVIISMITEPPATQEAEETEAAATAQESVETGLGNVEFVIDLQMGTSTP